MADSGPSAIDTFAELRSIIVGPEQRTLKALQDRLHDPAAQTRDVSRVLPDALQLRAHDPQLQRALAPSVEEAITASVQKNPHALADALFPVVGPAIRKAVANALDAMIDSINQTVERSISWHALQWRWTAWRTGKTFAEVVIANTLEYRVEQVFLIHRETGLLLLHVAMDEGAGKDADQISAMLTAITDFTRDMFKATRADTLESMRVGDLAVSLVPGPHAMLAAAVRGSIPPPVHASFESALESIHRQFGAALQGFRGDAAAFEPARPLLEACLVSQRRRPTGKPSYRGWAIAAAVLVLVVGIWSFFALRDRQRWNAYLARVRAEPGLVLIASGYQGGSYYVTGLRDPLARDPADFVAAASLAPDAIQGRWEPFQALHPPFVAARARLALRPPDGVTLSLDDGRLTATGAAPQRWIDDATKIAPAIAGVREFVFAGESAEAQLASGIERATITFAKGESAIDASYDQAIAALAGQLQALDAALASNARRARVEILGYTDSDGPDSLNSALSQARADRVRAVLEIPALTQIEFTARGLGRAPSRPGLTAEEQQQNRRTSFRVHLADAPASRRPSQ